MTYSEWMETQSSKHKMIINKLLKKKFTKEEIIEYFDFENMKMKELDFCPLYAQKKNAMI